MNAESLNRSWPRPLPTVDMVRKVFDNDLGHLMTKDADDPLRRISIARELLLRGERGPYDRIRRDLHKTMSVLGFNNDPRYSGRLVQRGAFEDRSPFVKYNGLDFTVDVQARVLPSLRDMTAHVLLGDDEPQAKLDKAAAVIGVITAEAQTLSDANTRVGRTLHDYLRDGPSGLSMDRLVDSSLHFSPPQSIEDLLMEQNAARLIEDPEEDPYGPEGIRSYSGYAQDVMMYAALSMDAFRDPEVKTYAEFNSQLRLMLPDDERLADATKLVLMQKKYSIAAWAAAFIEKQPELPLSTEDARKLIDANYHLLRMRVAGLALGILRGGDFISIEQSQDGQDASVSNERWWPPASF